MELAGAFSIHVHGATVQVADAIALGKHCYPRMKLIHTPIALNEHNALRIGANINRREGNGILRTIAGPVYHLEGVGISRLAFIRHRYDS